KLDPFGSTAVRCVVLQMSAEPWPVPSLPQAWARGRFRPGSWGAPARSLGQPARRPFPTVTLVFMSRTVIVSAVRTPFGRLGGGLKDHRATELGAIAIRAGLERAGLEPGEVGYVIMGQVLQGGAGQAPARQAAVGAGIPREVPADTVNKVCASSVRALEIADLMIRCG